VPPFPAREYFTGLRFGSILLIPVPFFTSMIWSRRSAARSNSRFATPFASRLQFLEELGQVEVAAGFVHDRRSDLRTLQMVCRLS
jgi:hypothetical protein